MILTFIYRWSGLVLALVAANVVTSPVSAAIEEPQVRQTISRGLQWLAYQQREPGHWTANQRYPTAMTALAGLALLCEGSTATQGKYAENIRRAVDFLTRRSRPNGLIGDDDDDRYTYGHGFAMLFLSQVLGEEEDIDRRRELTRVLTRAVSFTGQAQTKAGGWGYVSAKDGSGFDEGSTTITQVQGLRGCRNAGIPVPKEIIDQAIAYIRACTKEDGSVQYSSKGGGGRPAITAAAIACLYNAGEYDDAHVPNMLEYCKKHLKTRQQDSFGHWHYAHFYYAQVQYREGGTVWRNYRLQLQKRLLKEATEIAIGENKAVVWQQGYIGPVYTTSLNLIMLQLENSFLPIYQR
jgi:hypothetical protein